MENYLVLTLNLLRESMTILRSTLIILVGTCNWDRYIPGLINTFVTEEKAIDIAFSIFGSQIK